MARTSVHSGKKFAVNPNKPQWITEVLSDKTTIDKGSFQLTTLLNTWAIRSLNANAVYTYDELKRELTLVYAEAYKTQKMSSCEVWAGKVRSILVNQNNLVEVI